MRTFLALDIDESTRAGLSKLQKELARQIPGCNAKWVSPANLHVTLKFLGEVEDSKVNDVCKTVAEVAGRFCPIDFSVKGPVALPDRGPLRMFWVEVVDQSGQMENLFNEIEIALQPLGFDRERRKFRPHITLARVNRTADPNSARTTVAKFADEEPGSLLAKYLTIYTSTLTRQGPIYTPMSKPDFAR